MTLTTPCATRVGAFARNIETVFGDREIARIERVAGQNTAAMEFWKQYCALERHSLKTPVK